MISRPFISLVASALLALPPLHASPKLARGAGTAATEGVYDGIIAISGSSFVNGIGKPIQLRGANFSGMEYTYIQNTGASSPWQYVGNPNWTTYATWKPNAVRMPLNSQSFQGITVYPIVGASGTPAWGTGYSADGSAGTQAAYQAAIVTFIENARANGVYPILDLHWTAPNLTIGGVTHILAAEGQPPMTDSDVGLPFWTSSNPSTGLVAMVATDFGSAAFNTAHGFNGGAAGADYNASYGGSSGFADCIFELQNEPYADSYGGPYTPTSGSGTGALLLNGGTGSVFPNNTQSGTNFNISSSWNVAGFQAMVTGIRALGADNVLLIGGPSYDQEMENRSTWWPTDTLSTPQLAQVWHPYPYSHASYPETGSAIYPSIGTDSGAGTSAAFQWAEATLTAGIPVLIDEDGGWGGTTATNSPPEPHMQLMMSWSDTYGVGYLAWQWNGTQSSTESGVWFYLTWYTSGTSGPILPIQGAGVQLYDWMSTHP